MRVSASIVASVLLVGKGQVVARVPADIAAISRFVWRIPSHKHAMVAIVFDHNTRPHRLRYPPAS